MKKRLISLILVLLFVLSFSACGSAPVSATSTPEAGGNAAGTRTAAPAASGEGEAVITEASVTTDGAIDAGDLFTSRDCRQTPDLTDAVYCTLTSGEDITLTAAGVYVLRGTATDVTIVVDAADDDKVQLVLDGVTLTNGSTPCIYVKNADKVFVTTTDTDNALAVTGAFTPDGDTNTDAVIFSRDDLVFNGLGTLTITSTGNGISGKDDIKITGGALIIRCAEDAIEARDSICLAGGQITIIAQEDGLHAENDDDNTTGFVYICGGTLDITAGDDAIHATTIAQIDGGELTLSAAEGIEATWIQINGGTISLSASDDGINAARKSGAYTPVVEINGGSLTIVMGAGDTDAIDSNGNLYINGGTVDITAQSPFDYEGIAQYNGGTLIINGTETTTITNQMMGGGMMGDLGGMMGGGMGNGMPGGMGGPGGRR